MSYQQNAYTNLIGAGWAVNGAPLVPNFAGMPLTGTWYFVNAVTGSDGNPGTADEPLQSIPAAYALMTEGNNDVIVLQQAPTTAASTTGTFRLSAQLAWAKSACHMIGVTAPTMIGQRARISTATGATTNIADLLKVTAQGCIFSNFSMFQGVGQTSTAEQLCQITGQRNAFVNVAFQGMGSANGAGQSGSYDIYMNGGSENFFLNCQIGTDTEPRTAANANIKFAGGATRNIWMNCILPMYATATSPFFIDCNAVAAVDRFNWFKSCLFVNGVQSAGTATTAAISTNASQGQGE